MMAGLGRIHLALEHRTVERGRVTIHSEVGTGDPVDEGRNADRRKAGKKAVDTKILKASQGLDRLAGCGQHACGIAAAGMRA